jgi:hypothetical protein
MTDDAIEELKKDLYDGHCVFFVGSRYLDPPRSKYVKDIMANIQKDIILAEFKGSYKLRGAGIKGYENLRNYLDKLWSIENYADLQRLINKSIKVNTVITTLFDAHIANAIKKVIRNAEQMTGVESMKKDKTDSISQQDFVIYQLLGDILRPPTLRVSIESNSPPDSSMNKLRFDFINSDNATQFMRNRIKKMSLIALGFDSDDVYDNFFPQLLNDMYFKYSEPLLTKIYFINKLGYSTLYGFWENKSKVDFNIISSSPSDFVDKVVR